MNPPVLQVWWRHVLPSLLIFLPLAVLLATTNADVAIARSLFFDSASGRWMGEGRWIVTVIHAGGRWAIRGFVVAALAGIVYGCLKLECRSWRRPLTYLVISIVLGTGIVGLLKIVTNVDCPWDLQVFGGKFPFVPLFGDRPAGLRHAACFPAAHASSGYALVSLYFVGRERGVWLARFGLVAGLVVGCIFGVAQQARGAHFLSHDVWSFFIVWITAASVYAFGFGARLVSDAVTREEVELPERGRRARREACIADHCDVRPAPVGLDCERGIVCKPPSERGVGRPA